MEPSVILLFGIIITGYLLIKDQKGKAELPKIEEGQIDLSKTGRGIANILVNNANISQRLRIRSVEKVWENSAQFRDTSNNLFEIGYEPNNNSYYRLDYTTSGPKITHGKKLEDVIS